MKESSIEKDLRVTFEISIFLKGVFAFLEILGGLLLVFTSKSILLSVITYLTQSELVENPQDLVANFLLAITHNFSPSTQHFVSLYLLSHGAIKLLLVIGLFKKKLWAYPSAIIVFSIFIIYQIQRYFHTYSAWLLILTILDLIIIFLTWHEYTRIKTINQ